MIVWLMCVYEQTNTARIKPAGNLSRMKSVILGPHLLCSVFGNYEFNGSNIQPTIKPIDIEG